ncbi:MAG: DUF6544 family protein [Alkalibacterium sp.]|nr:DUF6544 family protein [Alkalibacterium sp.]
MKQKSEELPESVKRWFRYSGVVGKEKTVSVRLKQKAEMRLDKGGKRMPVQAEQYFTIEEPGFIWNARIKAAPFVHIAMAETSIKTCRGNMLIRPPVTVHSRGFFRRRNRSGNIAAGTWPKRCVVSVRIIEGLY